MKLIKRIVSVVLIMLLMMSTVLFSVTSYAYGSTVTMYAPDGRHIEVAAYEVQSWKNVGWYDYPVTTMYAPDGRQAVIYTGDVYSWKSVGWYDYPVTKMYAPDGRQTVIYTGDVAAWKAVGWYDYPVHIYGDSTLDECYPGTDNVLSFDPYGILYDQYTYTNADGSVDVYWGYYTSVDNANAYINDIENYGYYQTEFDDDGDYVYISYENSRGSAFGFHYYYNEDIALITYNLLYY